MLMPCAQRPNLMAISHASPTRLDQTTGDQGTREITPPIRYMGTKRLIAPIVSEIIREHCPSTLRVADLFAGLGSVTTQLAPTHSVAFNDSQQFTGPLARARFLNSPHLDRDLIVSKLRPLFDQALVELHRTFGARVKVESDVFSKGVGAVRDYLTMAPYVGNCPDFCRAAIEASQARGTNHYLLTTLYFSAGYFSTQQAMELDALRYSIDHFAGYKDRLLAAWLAAASAVINAPGHTAQYLKPSEPAAFARVNRQWKRSVWKAFISKLDSLQPVGTTEWRTRNSTHHADALAALSDPRLSDVGLVYADPPYTRDQYSRYYHVYETLFLYDYPKVEGRGRYRINRFRSAYSISGQVLHAFRSLLKAVAESDRLLILSYPTNGLLIRRGYDLEDLLDTYFVTKSKLVFPWRHSSLGAARGARFVEAHEQILLCAPR